MRLGTLLVAALAVGGCAGWSEPGEPGVEDDVVASMEVKVSRSSVRLVLHVTNTGEEALEFTFPTSQRYDFVVATRGGEEVWRWSEDMAFLQVVSRDALAPGESWDMEAVWDPGDRAGAYVATGFLAGRERELRQSASFELP